MTTTSLSDSPPHSATWRRWGRVAGYIAGPVFFLQTVLVLLDVAGVLAPLTGVSDTPAGVMEDLATYYVAANERMHTIWWDPALRDTLGPIGYVALMVLVIAVVRVAGTHQPRDEIAVLLVVLGGSLGALNDLMYLSYTRWWFHGGFRPTPDIVAFGTTLDAIDNLGTYLQRAGYLLLSLGFLLLAPTFGRIRHGWRWLSLLARLEAVALVAWVLNDVAQTGTTRYIAATAAGLVLGPALTIMAGYAIATRQPVQEHGRGEVQNL